jgi:hypothetical protein
MNINVKFRKQYKISGAAKAISPTVDRFQLLKYIRRIVYGSCTDGVFE